MILESVDRYFMHLNMKEELRDVNFRRFHVPSTKGTGRIKVNCTLFMKHREALRAQKKSCWSSKACALFDAVRGAGLRSPSQHMEPELRRAYLCGVLCARTG